MDDDPLLLAAVDGYCRALHACDTDLLDAAFHPASSLFDVDEAVVVRVDTYRLWRAQVAARPSPASIGQERQDEILHVMRLSPHCATVHVRLRILNEVFVDHLTFVREGDRYQIVAKTWHLQERIEAPASTMHRDAT